MIGSRANYASIKSAMIAIKSNPQLQLFPICFASAVLDKFGKVSDIMKKEDITPAAEISTQVEGDLPSNMVESTGVALLKIPQIFEEIKPVVVVTVGDRYETMASALAASYMNIILAHTMGGEVTGSIDESIRHAITKLAHLHFPATQDAADRIQRLGELSENISVVGCPRIDLARQVVERQDRDLSNLTSTGVGEDIDFNRPFVLLSQHPVTSEYADADWQIDSTIRAIQDVGLPAVILWPNSDAGAGKISHQIRLWRELGFKSKIHLYRNLPVEDYLWLMNNAACLVGNSSSGIREGAFLGTPVVNIGTRQAHRERAKNVLDVMPEVEQIREAIDKQINHGKFPRSLLYGDGNSGTRIASKLMNLNYRAFSTQKTITY